MRETGVRRGTVRDVPASNHQEEEEAEGQNTLVVIKLGKTGMETLS